MIQRPVYPINGTGGPEPLTLPGITEPRPPVSGSAGDLASPTRPLTGGDPGVPTIDGGGPAPLALPPLPAAPQLQITNTGGPAQMALPPLVDPTRPTTDTGLPGSDTGRPGTDTGQPGSDAGQPSAFDGTQTGLPPVPAGPGTNPPPPAGFSPPNTLGGGSPGVTPPPTEQVTGGPAAMTLPGAGGGQSGQTGLTGLPPLAPPPQGGNQPFSFNIPEGALVQDQMETILDEDSRYIRQATQRGLALAQSRGLLNSSAAVDAAVGAAIDRALPIAQQDAATIFNAARDEYQAEVQRQGQVLGIQAQFSLQELIGNQNLTQQERDIASRMSLLVEQGAQNWALQELVGNQNLTQQERDIAARWAQLIETGNQQMTLQELIGNQSLTQQERDFAGRALLLAQEAQERFSLQELIGSQTLTQQERLFLQQHSLLQAETQARTDLQELIGNQNMSIAELEDAFRQRQLDLQLDDAEQARLTQASVAIVTNYQQTVAAVAQNPELPANVRQNILNSLQATTEANLALLEDMFGTQLQWGSSVSSGIGAGTPPPAGIVLPPGFGLL